MKNIENKCECKNCDCNPILKKIKQEGFKYISIRHYNWDGDVYELKKDGKLKSRVIYNKETDKIIQQTIYGDGELILDE